MASIDDSRELQDRIEVDKKLQFWDKERKCRLREYPSAGAPASATGVNRDGIIFAFAISYDKSKETIILYVSKAFDSFHYR